MSKNLIERSKNLIESVAPVLSVPVKRVNAGTASSEDGAQFSDVTIVIILAFEEEA